MSFFHKLLKQMQQQSQEDVEMMDAMMTTIMMTHLDTSDEPQGCGLRLGRSPNHPKHRVSGGISLMVDYFIEHPIFMAEKFRRMYRMHTHLFNRIMMALYNHDSYWHQRADAIGKLGLLPQQKITGALRMLAYGAAIDQCAEICRMGESTTLECMKKFCQ
ncbi:PREDICTED: uncharacterized protein LOC101302408 [Fragaria vesca subsp. vesca]